MKKIIVALAILMTAASVNAQDYVITAYGASTDSTKLNTKAIQATIDLAAEKGGGTIVVPKGTFLTGALFFKPHTNLRLIEGAVLKGSDDIDNYPLIPSRMEGQSLMYYAALINAYYVDGFTIEGGGTINGNGLKYWTAFWAHRDSLKKIGKSSTNLEVHRPRLVFIWGCKDVVIRGVNLYNSGFWTTHLYQCRNVRIEDCRIVAPLKPIPAPSSDGIDLDVCKKVGISNCYVSVSDDGICMKGGKGPDAHLRPEDGIVEDVLVENCRFGPVPSALTMGSECVHAKNIVMRNCTMDNNGTVLRLKMRGDTHQLYEDIAVDHITGSCGTVIAMSPWTQFFDLKGSTDKPFGVIRNITVYCKSLGQLKGNADDQVSNITLKNVNATAKDNQFLNVYDQVSFDHVLVNGSAPVIVKSVVNAK